VGIFVAGWSLAQSSGALQLVPDTGKRRKREDWDKDLVGEVKSERERKMEKDRYDWNTDIVG
jgi:hypothetical protein